MYVALYRKRRPLNFREVVGQDAIVRTLKNQLTTERISHAYLFTGTRGTGKTTMAKIMSRAVNCTNPTDGEPCNECECCKLILSERSMDVVEIDAASNNGVDNIRDIREEAKYPPSNCEKKVYIIDEVHMLSTGAFNALLKTLEEPPPHVMFILATTDPQKLPATILSRCQRFDFKRLLKQDIKNTLIEYLKLDEYKYEDGAVELIAEAADGAMRDALSILDQCISFFSGDLITEKLVRDILGTVSKQVFFDFTKALFNKEQDKLLDLITEIVNDGRDIAQFVSDLILHFRNTLVAKVVDTETMALDYAPEHIEELKQMGADIPDEVLLSYIEIFSELQSQMKYASSHRILLEVAVFRTLAHEEEALLMVSGGNEVAAAVPTPRQPQMVDPRQDEELLALKRKLDAQEKKMNQLISQGVKLQASATNHTGGSGDTAEISKEPEAKPKPRAVPDDMKKLENEWDSLKTRWGQANMTFLTKTRMNYRDETLFLVCDNTIILSALKNKEEEIKEKLNNEYEKEIPFVMITEDDYIKKFGDSQSDLEILNNWIENK